MKIVKGMKFQILKFGLCQTIEVLDIIPGFKVTFVATDNNFKSYTLSVTVEEFEVCYLRWIILPEAVERLGD